MFVGPNAPISNGTLIPVIEKQATYMVSLIRKYQRQHLKTFCVSASATESLNRRHQKWLQRTVWTDVCYSTYKGGKKEGKVIGTWPGSSLHYFAAISEVKFEDWDYTYWETTKGHENDETDKGPWGYLGGGFTLRELKDRENGGQEDLAWYLKKPETIIQVDKN